jgi:hypothetical protein
MESAKGDFEWVAQLITRSSRPLGIVTHVIPRHGHRGRPLNSVVRWQPTMRPTRIYADFNGLVRGPKNPERIAVVLDTFGSLRDLANAGLILREGLPLIAVDWSDDEEDLEGHGTAQYDSANKRWVVEFDERGVRYVPAGDRSPVNSFLCVNCGQRVSVSSPGATFDPKASCSSCGTSVLTPYAPPSIAT